MTTLKRSVRALMVVLTLGLGLTAGTAKATSILYNDPAARDWAIGVNDVIVSNTRYNVSFVYGNFLAIFGDPRNSGFQPFPFWEDPSPTDDASWAVANALNAESPIPLMNPSTFGGLAYLVPRGPLNDFGGGAITS